MHLEHFNQYRHLTDFDLTYIKEKRIFFDPPDTEVGSWVGHDLLKWQKGPSNIIDLGSGSGATAASFVRQGAAMSIGVDISQDSLAWSRTQYEGSEYKNKIKFISYDFLQSSPKDLESCLTKKEFPKIITSNPPYVPMELEDEQQFISVYGGGDGLRYFYPTLDHALYFKADMGITLGSYSSLKTVFSLLESSGYKVISMTLCVLPFSQPTLDHFSRIQTLIERGEALIWKGESNDAGYIIVGIASVYTGSKNKGQTESLFRILEKACHSRTSALEELSGKSVAGFEDGVLRVLELPRPGKRRHW